MLPHDVLAGTEADDMPRAVVGLCTVSGHPVSHWSPMVPTAASKVRIEALANMSWTTKSGPPSRCRSSSRRRRVHRFESCRGTHSDIADLVTVCPARGLGQQRLGLFAVLLGRSCR